MKTKKKYIIKKGSLLIFGFVIIVTALTLASKNPTFTNYKNPAIINSKQSEKVVTNNQVCTTEELDALFVGCNGFF